MVLDYDGENPIGVLGICGDGGYGILSDADRTGQAERAPATLQMPKDQTVNMSSFVALAEDLEQQLRPSRRERHIAEFVDDQQLLADELTLKTQ